MQLGIYESLITNAIRKRLSHLDQQQYFVMADKKIDTEEAIHFLSFHLIRAISNALRQIKTNRPNLISKQIEVSNSILKYLTQQISSYQFEDDLIEAEGKILEAIFDRLNSDHKNLKLRLNEIMPTTRI